MGVGSSLSEEVQPRPFLRWAGSKRQLVPLLASFWKPTHSRYVEPFAGSACLYFRIRPRAAILGDLNEQLVETYRCVRDRPADLAVKLSEFETDRETYLQVRDWNPDDLGSVDRAARFVYLNRFCFNGLYRTNQAGKFNVPYGGKKSGSLPTEAELTACSKQLGSATLVAGDFGAVVKRVQPGDFVYMDPPFRVAARRTFRQYDPASFSDDDLARVRASMATMTNAGISFVVSYAESDESSALSQGFKTMRVQVRRNIAGFTSNRVRGKEVLIVSPDLEDGLND